MFKTHLRLKGIKDDFDDEALAQHELVSHGHQVVPHVAADTRNEVQAALPECLEQVLTDIAFVGVKFAGQMPGVEGSPNLGHSAATESRLPSADSPKAKR